MNYYLVTLKGGHVGQHRFAKIIYPIKAMTQQEAIDIAITLPRVKHKSYEDVLDIQESNATECSKRVRLNNHHPYFQAKCADDIALAWDIIKLMVYPEKPNEWADAKQKSFGKRYNKKSGFSFHSKNLDMEIDEEYEEYCSQNGYYNDGHESYKDSDRLDDIH